MPLDLQLIGTGIYAPREAARLAGVHSRDVLRWTRGGKHVQPLWRAYYQQLENSCDLSFRDMLEIRVVASLRRAGVSMQAIRFAIQFAERSFGLERPLSSQRFRTDGQEILIEALEDTSQLTSLSPKRPGQMVFKSVVEQSLKDLEYDGDDPIRWRPHRHPAVVIDPARAFGDPILNRSGISTSFLRSDMAQGNSVNRLARLYEIDPQEVRSALAFEQALDGQRTL